MAVVVPWLAPWAYVLALYSDSIDFWRDQTQHHTEVQPPASIIPHPKPKRWLVNSYTQLGTINFLLPPPKTKCEISSQFSTRTGLQDKEASFPLGLPPKQG